MKWTLFITGPITVPGGDTVKIEVADNRGDAAETRLSHLRLRSINGPGVDITFKAWLKNKPDHEETYITVSIYTQVE